MNIRKISFTLIQYLFIIYFYCEFKKNRNKHLLHYFTLVLRLLVTISLETAWLLMCRDEKWSCMRRSTSLGVLMGVNGLNKQCCYHFHNHYYIGLMCLSTNGISMTCGQKDTSIVCLVGCLFRSQAVRSCGRPQGSGILQARPFVLPPHIY